MSSPEERAREKIDQQLRAAGWDVKDVAQVNPAARPAVAVHEVTGDSGRADYVLYLDGRACGIIEAKRSGHPLQGVQEQSATYAAFRKWSDASICWKSPLPFRFEANGRQIQFTDARDPKPRARNIFHFPNKDYQPPDDGGLFSQIYNLQNLGTSGYDPVNQVVISTIQRLFAQLKGKDELDEEPERSGDRLPEGQGEAQSQQDEHSGLTTDVDGPPVEVTYQPHLPPESFDLIIVDEKHRRLVAVLTRESAANGARRVSRRAEPANQCLIFLRDVRSEILYTQMKGRGCRTIDPNDLANVTPDAPGGQKTRFVLIDAVGVDESEKLVA